MKIIHAKEIYCTGFSDECSFENKKPHPTIFKRVFLVAIFQGCERGFPQVIIGPLSSCCLEFQDDTKMFHKNLLGQWLNLKLFGITYLVGKISCLNFNFRVPLAKWEKTPP